MTLELFPYQEFAADWLARRERAALLDEVGIGKTAEVIRALDLRRAVRVVVVCPAHLREMWRGEFYKFGLVPRRVCKAQSVHDFVAWSRGVFDVLAVSYDMATRWKEHFDDHGEIFDALVIDESHKLKNMGAKRTRAVLGPHGDGLGGIAQHAVQGWFVTGTVNPNDPADHYTTLRFARATSLSRDAFVRRYFHSRPGTWGERNTPRKERLAELRGLITANSIRRTLKEVGHELPPIHLTTTLIDGDTTKVREMLAATPGLEQDILDAVEAGGLSRLNIEQPIATLRRLIAEAKAVPYAEMLADELDAAPDRKVVVMGISRDALLRIRDVLAARNHWSVVIMGGVLERARQDALTAFQGRGARPGEPAIPPSPACRALIGNMDSAGTGLTLTVSAHLDVFESSWVPATNAQGIGRIRRRGQEREQHARFVMLARSLDEVVVQVVADKTAAIALVDGEAMMAAPVREVA